MTSPKAKDQSTGEPNLMYRTLILLALNGVGGIYLVSKFSSLPQAQGFALFALVAIPILNGGFMGMYISSLIKGSRHN